MRLMLAFLLVLASQGIAEATKQYITLDGARLLAKPQAFSASYGSLRRGQVVWAEPAQGGYLRVRVEKQEGQSLRATMGFVSKNALQKNRPRLGTSYVQSKDASAVEVAAATKGFNKQVEADYARDKKLDYGALDAALARSQGAGVGLEAFKQAGKLGEFAGGGR